MRGSKTSKHMLAVGLEPFEIGEEFMMWPLHITLVPWFPMAPKRELIRELYEIAESTKPFAVNLGMFALFGANAEIPVRLIESSTALDRLHSRTLTAVHRAGGFLNSYSDVSYGFKPHISLQHHEEVEDTYKLDHMALIRNEGGKRRKVEEVFQFND